MTSNHTKYVCEGSYVHYFNEFFANNSKIIRKYAIPISGCCEGSAAGNKAWNEHLCCSVRPKPLFWFRSNTDTETQIGRYFRADIVTNTETRF